MSFSQYNTSPQGGSSSPAAPPPPPVRKPGSIGMGCYDSLKPCVRENDLFLAIKHHSMPFANPSKKYAPEDKQKKKSWHQELEGEVLKKFQQGEYRWASSSKSVLLLGIKYLYLALMMPLYFFCYELPRSFFCELLPLVFSYGRELISKLKQAADQLAQWLVKPIHVATEVAKKWKSFSHFSLKKSVVKPKNFLIQYLSKLSTIPKKCEEKLLKFFHAFTASIKHKLKTSFISFEKRLRSFFSPLEKIIERMLWRIFVAPFLLLWKKITTKCFLFYKKIKVAFSVLYHNYILNPLQKLCEGMSALRLKWLSNIQKLKNQGYWGQATKRPKKISVPAEKKIPFTLFKNYFNPFLQNAKSIFSHHRFRLSHFKKLLEAAVTTTRENLDGFFLKNFFKDKLKTWQQQFKLDGQKEKVLEEETTTTKEKTFSFKAKQRLALLKEYGIGSVRPIAKKWQHKLKNSATYLTNTSSRLGRQVIYKLSVISIFIKLLSRHGMAMVREKTPKLRRRSLR